MTELTKLCGERPEYGGSMVCISEPGHRGRHKFRNPEEIKLVSLEAEVNESVMTPTTPEVAVVELEHPSEEDVEPGEQVEAHWHPPADVFLNLKGKMYLPARRRVQWLRGEPIPHPDWTIDTDIERYEAGKFIRAGRVEGGYAVVRGNVYDETGRLIATGLKTEYSENFADFLEKAETGAIARALAVAGYGTESALDFDEGIDKERIADSPVEPPAKPVIGKSEVPGVGRGGKTEGASTAQIKRVSELSRKLELGPVGLATMIESVMGMAVPELGGDSSMQSIVLANFLAEQSAARVGELISILENAVATSEK